MKNNEAQTGKSKEQIKKSRDEMKRIQDNIAQLIKKRMTA